MPDTRKIHLGDFATARAACGVDVARGGWTTAPERVTCRRCLAKYELRRRYYASISSPQSDQ
jgi:hypothetical protein